MISIITPWLDSPELIPDYEAAVSGAQVIILDNGSDNETGIALREMVQRLGGGYIRNDANRGYAEANNQGLEAASGEVTIFLNNDITADPGWLDQVGESVKSGALYGPSLGMRYVDGAAIAYLEGWCLIGKTDELREIGGWNANAFPGLYWEDNELCWRAMRHGLSLKQIALPIQHINNYTSAKTPGAYDNSAKNRAVFEQIVRHDRENSHRMQ